MVEDIIEVQYRQLNEFPLSGQTRSLAVQRSTAIIEKHEGYAVQYLKAAVNTV